jgi:nucleotide-binding universal stress UspA family protein
LSETAIFGRVLVALDASPHSLTALEAGVELAALFDVELLGIFVEDADLLRLAELPLASEVASFSASIQPLDAERMRLQLRAVAERARRALATSAERARVRWSFRVARGQVSAAVMESVGGRDLISVGRVGWSRLGKTGLGSTARAILCEAQASALVLQRDRRMGTPLCVIYDGTKAARRAVEAVARLARGGVPTVLIVASDEKAAERLEREAEEQLRARGMHPRLRRLVGKDRTALLGVIRAEGPGLLVLPAEAGTDLGDFLAEIESPVLVVRDTE